MEKTTALYAYFGELGIFFDDIPGHTFYQIGLLDSISHNLGIDQFDFYNYLDEEAFDPNLPRPQFPDGLGSAVFTKYSDRLIDNYRIQYLKVLENIKEKKYSHVILKARFRNLSTLAKKINDTHRFEQIILAALDAGYDPSNIIILDTDLSLSDNFLNFVNEHKIKILTPSISISAIGTNFIYDCLQWHKDNISSLSRNSNLFYYGNLDTSNYKPGHTKNKIIHEIIDTISGVKTLYGQGFNLKIAAKETPLLGELIDTKKNVSLISRKERFEIWQAMETSLLSINVSKDKYIMAKFTPARVYESVALGIIPVSYKASTHPAMAFNDVDQFFEICKFLSEVSPTEYLDILEKVSSTLY